MILINGKESSSLTISDRGFQYGDGLFETIAVENGKPLLLQRHLDRLILSCHRIGIDSHNLREKFYLEANLVSRNISKGILKLICTRGIGGRGYRAPEIQHPTRIVSSYPWPDYPTSLHNGIKATICQTPVSRNSVLAGMKHLNRLDQVIARNEWSDSTILEGFMFDDLGNLIEGTMSNIFIRIGRDELLTPDLSYSGVSGIMRNVVLEICENIGIKVSECNLSKQDLIDATEVLITNSVIRVLPIRHLVSYNKEYYVSDICQIIRQHINTIELSESRY